MLFSTHAITCTPCTHAQIEYWFEQKNAMEAYKLIEQMRKGGILLAPYLDQRMVGALKSIIYF